MSWTPQNSKSNEAAKIRWELVPYFHGYVLDIGCGGYKAFPHFIGVDNGKQWGRASADVMVETMERLPIFGSQSCDTVFSSHALEHIINYQDALREWWRLVKPNGHLVLYLPHKDLYPNKDGRHDWQEWKEAHLSEYATGYEALEAYANLRRAKGMTTVGAIYSGTPFANGDHQHDFYPEDIIKVMEEIGGWDLVENQVRDQGDEYSMFLVFKKVAGNRKTTYSHRDPKPAKTCAIIRYGAYGDMIQTSSLFPWLKEQGYHITLYCQTPGVDIIRHDPHIDRIIVQGKDEVPPQALDEFWSYTRKKYDKWINLCESVEGTLLAIPGRPNHEWPAEVRRKFLSRNFLEWTHELAEVPPTYHPVFYATEEEKKWARKTADKMGRRNILWSLSGSSGHKTWPWLDTVVATIMLRYPDTHVLLVGDELCALLETGWEKEPRVHCLSGRWSMRQSMAFAEVADLVVGAETGLLNAAGHMDVPKIITMSHSTTEMLTKHWKNTIALEQPKGIGCPKQPCLQMHYDWSYCMKHEQTGTAVCQAMIGPDMMWEAIESTMEANQRKVA